MRTTALILIALSAVASAHAAESGFVVHEWGTFTSHIDPSGETIADVATFERLPSFVYTRTDTGAVHRFADVPHLGFKRIYRARQRMETPVIYVHSDIDRVIDVTVRFPQGLMSEWFPWADDLRPIASRPLHDVALTLAGDRIGWPQVEVLAAAAHPELASALPLEPTDASPYYAARAVDAAYLRVPATANAAQADEVERFLFYRGLGDFASPLGVRIDRMTQVPLVRLANALDVPIHGGVIVRRSHGRLTGLPLRPIEAGGNDVRPFFMPEQSEAFLSDLLRDQLVGAGLRADEADAMVATWGPAWLRTDGVRVLYILPQAWVDRTLPLTIAPAPDKIVRVFVGRAELVLTAPEPTSPPEPVAE